MSIFVVTYAFLLLLHASVARACRLIGCRDGSNVFEDSQAFVDRRLAQFDPIRVRIEVLQRVQQLSEHLPRLRQILASVQNVGHD